MRPIMIFLAATFSLVAMGFLTSCHTGKSAATRSRISVADSIKYAKVKDAFLSGEFVFKINRKGNRPVPAVDNWLKFSGGRIYYQHVGHIYSKYVDDSRYNPPIRVEAGDIKRLEYTTDEEERTITLTAADTQNFYYISITYYEGSNKAYGYLESFLNVEGWLEPLDDAIVVQGYQSIIYDD